MRNGRGPVIPPNCKIFECISLLSRNFYSILNDLMKEMYDIFVVNDSIEFFNLL